jgi:hypothetical protein
LRASGGETVDPGNETPAMYRDGTRNLHALNLARRAQVWANG